MKWSDTPPGPDVPVEPGEVVDERWLARLTGVAIVVALLLRLVVLAVLPGEMYGDITIVWEYVHRIRGGEWPTYFDLSSGPLYHYLIAPITLVFGLDFTGLKIASVLVSLGVLAVTYVLARQLVDRSLAVMTLFISSVSSWLLVFSRLGNSQILTPLLTVAVLVLLLRASRTPELWPPALAGLVAAAGLLAYPQTFVLAPVMFVTLLCMWATGTGIGRRQVFLFAGGVGVGGLLFVVVTHRSPVDFSNGYVGSKFDGGSDWLSIGLGNVWRSALAFNWRGDRGFRSNPVNQPHLDLLSGLLMLIGILVWLQPARRRWAPVVLVPFVLLQVPAALVLAVPADVPSASRTLLVAPLAYLLVATGLWWIVGELRRRRGARVALAICVALLSVVTVTNTRRYFVDYADGLPNHNTPFGRVIADYLEGQPDETHAFLVGCCWGEWGQPEPKGIRYLDANPPANRLVELPADAFDCAALHSLPRPAVVIWSPSNDRPSSLLDECASEFDQELRSAPNGTAVFHVISLPDG